MYTFQPAFPPRVTSYPRRRTRSRSPAGCDVPEFCDCRGSCPADSSEASRTACSAADCSKCMVAGCSGAGNCNRNHSRRDCTDIDVKPRSDTKAMNCHRNDKLFAAAILITRGFDATRVDHTTMSFEGVSEIHVNRRSDSPKGHRRDLDRNGDLDLAPYRPADNSATFCRTAIGEKLSTSH